MTHGVEEESFNYEKGDCRKKGGRRELGKRERETVRGRKRKVKSGIWWVIDG